MNIDSSPEEPALEQSGIAEVLEFWFADISAGFEVKSQHKIWYGGTNAIDQEIKHRFGDLVSRAMAGQLSHWQQSPAGVMALVLLLDQFTRNIYRGSNLAFAGDARARAVVISALERGDDRRLTFIQRSFIYMPLEHSESLEDQQRCVDLFEQLLTEVPEVGRETISASLSFAIKHRDIIARFGRFPHRNAAMGRASTAEELSYLSEGGTRFGQ